MWTAPQHNCSHGRERIRGKRAGRPYLLARIQLFPARLLGRLLLRVADPLLLPPAKACEVFLARRVVEGDFLDARRRLALLGRRRKDALLGPGPGEHGGRRRAVSGEQLRGELRSRGVPGPVSGLRTACFGVFCVLLIEAQRDRKLGTHHLLTEVCTKRSRTV